MNLRHTLYLVLVALCLTFAPPANSDTNDDSQKNNSIEWWRDAKFGLFVHWGPVSLVGTEIGWSRAGERRGTWRGPGHEVPVDIYDALYKTFNPIRFNPDEWVDIARGAGMKYLVFTSRHHDGFSMWDTKVSEYKITSPTSPYRRDIVRMIGDATRKGGLRFGVYYSQPDWHHPDAFTNRHNKFRTYLYEQVKELMSDYGRIDILWFDGLGDRVHYEDDTAALFEAKRIHPMARKLQPQILINNRNGHPEDFDTPEQRVGHMQIERPWESCITIAQQWAWKPGDVLKSLDELLGLLVTTVTGDGNLLLNVGPMPDGRIEPRQADRLRQMGDWLKENADAIYGTRGGPWVNGMWGGSTYRGNTIYVHLLRPAPGDRLRLAPLPHHILSAELHTRGALIKFTQDNNGVTLMIPETLYVSPVTIIKLTVAEPVAPGQKLGKTGGLFTDEVVFGHALKHNVTARSSRGEPVQSSDGAWSVHIDNERNLEVIFDLGRPRQLTGLYSVNAEPGTIKSHASLDVSLSVNGHEWQEVWRGSYGLPMWEIIFAKSGTTTSQEGNARFIRIRADYGNDAGSLSLKDTRIYAK